MWSVVTDRVVWSVCLFVCRSVTLVRSAKTAEAIFRVEDLGGPREPYQKGQFFGKEVPHCKYRDFLP